ncbi:MAG: diguanylate cyclase [Thiohalophilus sp.]|uniref:GGDEF domain-containing protein n=1 Tax=Thiohalophilus sp. TaxID=3028392 RepID=UPI00286FEF02|nr:diguanylate cyclase [Thiohalophilus sp.]MDR9436383.1 diguanylate cyclase [Thiohalophilus sp.]
MLLGTGLMLLPLLLLGIVGYLLYLQTIDSFESVIQESLPVGLPVSELHRDILQLDMPLDRYLLSGSQRERQRFGKQTRDIDRQFTALLNNSGLLREYRRDISRAAASWRELVALGKAIIERDRTGHTILLADITHFEEQQQKTSRILDEVYTTLQVEIRTNYQNALHNQQQIQVLLLVVFLAGVLVAIHIGNRLARQVLRPLTLLREGTERFGNGDLSHRIELENRDEFGQLANTFNNMADELEFLASYDSLTGLLNKREFELRLQDEVRRAKRSRHPFVLLLMDLDYFKQVNDTYGHPAGDHTLRVLSSLLKKQVRESDYVGRYGGEEFGMILTDTSEKDARDTAERIRQLVEEKAFTISDNATINITVSAGLACYPDDAANAEMLIACADEALYKAKDAGRNRVISFSDI